MTDDIDPPKLGRPTFKPTKAQREEVAILAGGGTPHNVIAEMIGITKPTLYKHFEDEISTGALKRRAKVLAAVYRQSLKGNVTAARFYLEHEPVSTAPPVPKELEVVAEPAKPEGKKAQADADAKVAQIGTEWEALLAPARHQ